MDDRYYMSSGPQAGACFEGLRARMTPLRHGRFKTFAAQKQCSFLC
jgi:hypothetical protein